MHRVMDVIRDWSLLVVASLVTLICIVRYQWDKSQNLPPGPFALPVVGNLHMLGKQPWRSLKNLADKHGSVMFLRLGSVPTVVISSSESAKLFFKTHDRAFSGRPDLAVKCIFYKNQDVGMCEYGDEWNHRRRICTLQLLNTKRVELMRPSREEEATSMIRKLWAQSRAGSCKVNLTDALSSYSFDSFWRTIARRGFSGRSEELIKVIHKITILMLQGSLEDFIPWMRWFDWRKTQRKMVEVSKEFDIFANAVLKEHIALGKPASDEVASFIDVLLEISKGDPNFTHENIKAIILDMTIAATGTTGAILEWVTCLLLKHPTCLSALQKEINEVVGSNEELKEEHLSKMKYLKCVVKQGIRLYAPSPLGFPRESTEAVIMNDYCIPKGTRLLVNLWAIGRDPEVWDKPDEFIPERFAELDDIDFTGWSDFKSLPFSAGRRGCPGANLAMPTILLGLATLFHSFQISVNEDHSTIDMGEKNSIVMSREKPLFTHLKLALNTSTLYFENQ